MTPLLKNLHVTFRETFRFKLCKKEKYIPLINACSEQTKQLTGKKKSIVILTKILFLSKQFIYQIQFNFISFLKAGNS